MRGALNASDVGLLVVGDNLTGALVSKKVSLLSSGSP